METLKINVIKKTAFNVEKYIKSYIKSKNDGFLYVITTMKRYNKIIMSDAQECKRIIKGDLDIIEISNFKSIYLNNLDRSIIASDKNLIEIHKKALEKFLSENKDKYTGIYKIDGKETIFNNEKTDNKETLIINSENKINKNTYEQLDIFGNYEKINVIKNNEKIDTKDKEQLSLTLTNDIKVKVKTKKGNVIMTQLGLNI